MRLPALIQDKGRVEIGEEEMIEIRIIPSEKQPIGHAWTSSCHVGCLMTPAHWLVLNMIVMVMVLWEDKVQPHRDPSPTV